jgi:hypothetical protein
MARVLTAPLDDGGDVSLLKVGQARREAVPARRDGGRVPAPQDALAAVDGVAGRKRFGERALIELLSEMQSKAPGPLSHRSAATTPGIRACYAQPRPMTHVLRLFALMASIDCRFWDVRHGTETPAGSQGCNRLWLQDSLSRSRPQCARDPAAWHGPSVLARGAQRQSHGEGARWMPTIQGLAPDFRVIAPDQIGWGGVFAPACTGPGNGQDSIAQAGKQSTATAGRAAAIARAHLPQGSLACLSLPS